MHKHVARGHAHTVAPFRGHASAGVANGANRHTPNAQSTYPAPVPEAAMTKGGKTEEVPQQRARPPGEKAAACTTRCGGAIDPNNHSPVERLDGGSQRSLTRPPNTNAQDFESFF